MPDDRLVQLLSRYRRRFLAAGFCMAIIAACAATGAVLAAMALTPLTASALGAIASATLVGVVSVLGLLMWRRWTLRRVALGIEGRAPLDNLVVTAEEIISGRSPARHLAIRDEVLTSAAVRVEGLSAGAVRPLAAPVAAAVLALGSVAAMLVTLPDAAPVNASAPRQTTREATRELTPGDLRVRITAPAYAQRPPHESINPTSVTALEGSQIVLEVELGAPDGREGAAVVLQDIEGRRTPFAFRDGRALLELSASVSRPLLVRQTGRAGATVDRLVHLRVDPDERATVAIREPAKDLVFPEGRGRVPIQIEARDDVALQSLVLRYTRVSGSGETFTFQEGEWPIEITREGAGSWRGRAVLALESLGLEDGDSLVYRAVARDGRPGADPSSSDSYLIEIGRLTGVASQGFALPEERDRQAISQQMLIIKTERLHATKGQRSETAFLEESQLLAVEQRMVQAEFVFMTGGHVHDEVEEAERSHELAEGRLENSATVEMLNAIREMSRAEARLNAGDTATALTHERAALDALQRAFDRRRYFLRTLPERARIDVSRRLTGELDTARSSTLTTETSPVDPLIAQARSLLGDLSRADAGGANLALLASRLLSLPDAPQDLQVAALELTAANDEAVRVQAVQDAQRAIVEMLRARLAQQVRLPLAREPLIGRVVQELPPQRPPR